MDINQEELLKLLRCFADKQVRYLVIGGLAINRYGYHRTTGDVDFLIEDNIENRQNLIEALEQAEYGRYDMLLTLPMVPGYCEILMNNGMYADLMTEIPGLSKDKFKEYYKEALREEVNGIPIRFIHYNRLIENKKATGRPKDLLDVQELEKIRNNNRE